MIKWSKLNTIPFESNDFQQPSKMAVIVPKGAIFVLVELKTNTQNTIRMPATATLINQKTGAKTTINNGAIAKYPCIFEANMPANTPCGHYKIAIQFTNGLETSKIFQVVNFDENICEVKTNNVEARLFDGTPSIMSGREFYFYHYFYKDNFSKKIKEKNIIYNDNRGTVRGLLNENYEYLTLSGFCNEYTSKALGVCFSNSFVMLSFKGVSKTWRYFELWKNGEISLEQTYTDAQKFECDFNFHERIFNKKMLPSNKPIKIDGIKKPEALFCQSYRNPDFQDDRGNLWNEDLSDNTYLAVINFFSDKIPDNFMRSVQKYRIFSIQNSDFIKEIGNNVNLTSITPFKFTTRQINKVGKNLKISDIDGKWEFSNVRVLDGLKFEKNAQNSILVKNCTLKNLKADDKIKGDIIKYENCKVENVETTNERTIFDGCIFDDNLIIPKKATIKNCNFKNKVACIDLRGFVGTVENSFVAGMELNIKNNADTAFTSDKNSFSFVQINETIPYVFGQVPIGNIIAIAPTNTAKFLKINNQMIKSIFGNIFLTTDLQELNNPTITAIEVPVDFQFESGDMNGIKYNTTIPLGGELADNCFNPLLIQSNDLYIDGTFLTKALQHNDCLNIVNNLKRIMINNDLPLNFDYLSLKNNGTSFKITPLPSTIIVTNDNQHLLRDRLIELFPTYNII